MPDAPGIALAALAQLERGSDRLAAGQRDGFRRHLRTIAQALGGRTAPVPAVDPYARLIGPGPRARALGTPLDLQAQLGGGPPAEGDGGQAPPPVAAAPAQPAAPPRPDATATIGTRAAEALEAVSFTDFVAGLVRGTFQAIVDATAQQMREYADLVASISRSAADFTRDNVDPSQARLWLANRHPADLYVAVPAPGVAGAPALRPQPSSAGQSPAWLANYGLDGEELSDELAEGPLLAAGRSQLGEERLQQLATMVLMGINRVVVKDGQIAAKLQFHATARDRTAAELSTETRGQQGTIAQRQSDMSAGALTMVSTAKANAQADAAIRADLMGEVQIRFATETFNLNNFADGQAIQLISRHARWKGEAAPAATAPAAAPAAPPATGGG